MEKMEFQFCIISCTNSHLKIATQGRVVAYSVKMMELNVLSRELSTVRRTNSVTKRKRLQALNVVKHVDFSTKEEVCPKMRKPLCGSCSNIYAVKEKGCQLMGKGGREGMI